MEEEIGCLMLAGTVLIVAVLLVGIIIGRWFCGA